MATSKIKTSKLPKENIDPKVLRAAFILVVGSIAPLLDSTMVNVAIKTLTIDLKSTVSVIQWVITGYMLAMGLAIPVSGWAVKRFGGKNVYLFSLVVFFAGSLLSSLSWNIESLIVFRLLQGVGAGLLVPTMQTILVQLSGSRSLGRLISVISIPSLLAPIIGPVLGGIIVDALSWRWIFYINIPITAISLLLARRGLPSDKSLGSKQPLDIAGLLLLSPAFALLIYGIAQVSQYGGLNSSAVIIPLAAGLGLMAAFVVYALRTKKEPVLDLRLLKIKNFSASNIMFFLSGMVMNGALLLLPLYYQQVWGQSVLFTGLLLIPQGVGMLITRGWIGRLSDRMGPRMIVMVSLAVSIAGTLPFAFAGPDANLFLLGAAMLVLGAARNGLFIPVMVSAYVGLNKDQIPHSSIFIRIFQTIGGAFGAAILATVIGNQTAGSAVHTIQSVAGAYNAGFWWLIGFCVIAFIPALLLTSHKNVEER